MDSVDFAVDFDITPSPFLSIEAERKERARAADRRRGARYRCKPENREAYLASCRVKSKAWRAANLEKAKATNLAYRKANPEKVRAFKQRIALRLAYGITPEQKAEMLSAQGGTCKLCGTDAPGTKGWVVDHEHKTGRIRGVLCPHCNVGLGYFRDSPDLLQRAIHYLGEP